MAVFKNTPRAFALCVTPAMLTLPVTLSATFCNNTPPVARAMPEPIEMLPLAAMLPPTEAPANHPALLSVNKAVRPAPVLSITKEPALIELGVLPLIVLMLIKPPKD